MIAPNRLYSFVSIVLVANLFGCQSKNSEASPDVIDIKKSSLIERVSQKEKVDIRINDVQKIADQVTKLLNYLGKHNKHKSLFRLTPL